MFPAFFLAIIQAGKEILSVRCNSFWNCLKDLENGMAFRWHIVTISVMETGMLFCQLEEKHGWMQTVSFCSFERENEI